MAAGDGNNSEVDDALLQLFKAYDLDESGLLSREEFLKIEMRLAFEAGKTFHEEHEMAKLTLADKDHSGTLDFQEFRERELEGFSEMGLTKATILDRVREHTKRTLTERARMGPRYHAGVRQMLKRIFQLYDVNGDATLSAEEWIAAQKLVALEISDEIDEAWIDEGAFSAADTNGDGVVSREEFLEASFTMFESVKRRTEDLLATLDRVVGTLEAKRKEKVRETQRLTVLVQTSEKPEFNPPHTAWQDEPTVEDREKNANMWTEAGQIILPMNLETSDEVHAAIRLCLQMSADTWLATFFEGPVGEGDEGFRPITLLQGNTPGEGNVQSMLDYLSKPNASPRLYVKNKRQRPKKLKRMQRAFLEERDALLAKHTGVCWGLDWETMTVGLGEQCPRPMVISPNDALIVEVPRSDSNGEFGYVWASYMDATDVLSSPVDKDAEVKTKGKKKKSAGPAPDPLIQLAFVALKEGKCILFVEVSWEDQEEKLCAAHKLTAPCADNTVARIGPIEVEVSKNGPAGGKDKVIQFQWWNGEKWSAKKGPAKKKGKKK